MSKPDWGTNCLPGCHCPGIVRSAKVLWISCELEVTAWLATTKMASQRKQWRSAVVVGVTRTSLVVAKTSRVEQKHQVLLKISTSAMPKRAATRGSHAQSLFNPWRVRPCESFARTQRSHRIRYRRGTASEYEANSRVVCPTADRPQPPPE